MSYPPSQTCIRMLHVLGAELECGERADSLEHQVQLAACSRSQETTSSPAGLRRPTATRRALALAAPSPRRLLRMASSPAYRPKTLHTRIT